MNVIKALRDYIIKVVRITQGMKVLVLDAETVLFFVGFSSILKLFSPELLVWFILNLKSYRKKCIYLNDLV